MKNSYSIRPILALAELHSAVEWLRANAEHQLYISDIAVLELYAGCRNNEERDKIDHFRHRFTSVYLSPDDTAWAVTTFGNFV